MPFNFLFHEKKDVSELEDGLPEKSEEKDPLIDCVIDSFEERSYLSLNYLFPEYEGRELKPGHKLYFSIPEDIENTEQNERIYCEGTEFIDIKNKKLLPKYGGGSYTEGKYVGAIALNQSSSALYELGDDAGEGVERRSDAIEINLESGKSLLQVEVSIGDTEHLSYINPKTGKNKRLGYAKLWMGIRRATTENVEWFSENLNIPPQGVLVGAPKRENLDICEGDKLIIESRDDAAYLMGWRITYGDKKQEKEEKLAA